MNKREDRVLRGIYEVLNGVSGLPRPDVEAIVKWAHQTGRLVRPLMMAVDSLLAGDPESAEEWLTEINVGVARDD